MTLRLHWLVFEHLADVSANDRFAYQFWNRRSLRFSCHKGSQRPLAPVEPLTVLPAERITYDFYLLLAS